MGDEALFRLRSHLQLAKKCRAQMKKTKFELIGDQIFAEKLKIIFCRTIEGNFFRETGLPICTCQGSIPHCNAQYIVNGCVADSTQSIPHVDGVAPCVVRR